VGGDLRVEGRAPNGAWSVAVEDPNDRTAFGPVLALAGGGVATSAPGARRWVSGGVERHHLLCPTTGAPARDPVAAVTVAAATAASAEALTKVPFAYGANGGVTLFEAWDVAALVVGRDGSRRATTAWSRLVPDRGAPA
jgi:thiamine biosynthesis lipoprotein